MNARRRAIRGQHHRDWNKAYFRKNKDKYEQYQKSYKYGIPVKDLVALRQSHPTCMICGNDNDGAKLVIDHDHASDVVRGLLCKCCNWGLGHFRDNPALLHKAAMYLLEHKKIGEVA